MALFEACQKATDEKMMKNLDKAIEQAFGPGDSFLQTRTHIANAIVGQMLPAGVIKGGSSLKFRWGDKCTRFTNDLDTA